VKLKKAMKCYILKWFQDVIDFLMHNAGSTYFKSYGAVMKDYVLSLRNN